MMAAVSSICFLNDVSMLRMFPVDIRHLLMCFQNLICTQEILRCVEVGQRCRRSALRVACVTAQDSDIRISAVHPVQRTLVQSESLASLLTCSIDAVFISSILSFRLALSHDHDVCCRASAWTSGSVLSMIVAVVSAADDSSRMSPQSSSRNESVSSGDVRNCLRYRSCRGRPDARDRGPVARPEMLRRRH